MRVCLLLILICTRGDAMGKDYELVLDRELMENRPRAERIIQRAVKGITDHIPELSYVFEKLSLLAVGGGEKISTNGMHLIYNPQKVVITRQNSGIGEIQRQMIHVAVHYLRGDILTYRKCAHKELMGAIMDKEVSQIISGAIKGQSLESANTSNDYFKMKYDPKAAESFVINAKELYASDDHSLWIDYRICDKDLEKELLDVLQKMYGKKIAESIVKGFRSIDTELKAKYGCPLYNLLGKNAGEYSINDETEYAPSDSSTDYKKVIERLMKEMIVEKESTEILDRNLYCYGLDMYGDVALVEPGEDEIEKKGLKGRLAIAIDTSGSCQGDIANRFLGEVGRLFSQIMDGANDNDLEVVLFECDYRITNEEVLKNYEVQKAFAKGRKLTGGGGTSFIPVFDRVKALADKDGRSFNGLIYFSDGYGDYPVSNPIEDMPVIFVLPNQGNDEYYESLSFPNYVEKVFMRIEDEK